MKTGGEVKLIERAMKQKWAIPPKAFTEIPATLFKIAKDGSNRDQVAAARLLKAMNDANADLEPPGEKPQVTKPPQVHLHADITGALDGNVDERRLAIIGRIRSLIGNAGGTGGDRVVIEQLPDAAGRQADPPPKSSARKQPKAKSTRTRNRRDTSGK